MFWIPEEYRQPKLHHKRRFLRSRSIERLRSWQSDEVPTMMDHVFHSILKADLKFLVLKLIIEYCMDGCNRIKSHWIIAKEPYVPEAITYGTYVYSIIINVTASKNVL